MEIACCRCWHLTRSNSDHSRSDAAGRRAPECADEHTSREAHVKRCQIFHAAIVELSGNDRLAELLGQLEIPILMLEWRSTMTVKEIETSQAEHLSIAKIILDGRADQADTAMRRHLQRARDRTLAGT